MVKGKVDGLFQEAQAVTWRAHLIDGRFRATYRSYGAASAARTRLVTSVTTSAASS